MRNVELMAVVAVALGATGCGGPHLIHGYGESYARAFRVQQERTRPPAQAATGLDPQDAAITADNYRRTLFPEGKEEKPQNMLYLSPPARDRREPLAPSVPKE